MPDYDKSLSSAFFDQLWFFYSQNRGKIRSRYNQLTKKFLAYNDPDINPDAFLRRPQFEALEMYVFIKEHLNNDQVSEIFDQWSKHAGIFSDESYYAIEKHGQQTLISELTADQTQKLFKQMRKYREEYPNYIYALTMGLGKTILMATCIFYEFLLAKKYPKDERYCHNALVFAPDKTVLESLREIITFDKSLVVPPEYVKTLEPLIKVYFLDDAGLTLHVLDGSDYNIVISNTQKIINKRKHKEDTPADRLFQDPISDVSLLEGIYGPWDLDATDSENRVVDESTLIENQRFTKLTRLKRLGVYVDEAHHLFGAALEKEIRKGTAAKTSLRDTINLLAQRTSVVACYNFTGTPYVKTQPLPEVVYAYGLREAIQNGFLKDAFPQGFEDIKGEAFVRNAIKEFWNDFGSQTYEGLNPKLCFFATTIDEAQNELRPMVEAALGELGLPASKILVNVGDAKLTKDEDIKNFNELDVPGSAGNDKQFIILVGKGREGWNCRSLFGVAMFRSPKSKVFVLQATMRCLRQITDQQYRARVFLSEHNFDTLDAELQANFNMTINDMRGKGETNSVAYAVKVVPPVRTLSIKEITHHYDLIENQVTDPIDFGLDSLDFDKYKVKIRELDTLRRESQTKERADESLNDSRPFSELTLVAEIARYLNMKALDVCRYLATSVDGMDKIVEVVSRFNEVLYDHIIPTLFNTLWIVKSRQEVSDREVVLLKEPKDGDSYTFHAKPELVITKTGVELTDDEKVKTFHADTYCFDSKPERECFLQYVSSNKVEEVYFTGMFTSGQSELQVQYYDPETQRIRSYYPDFLAKMKDGTYQLIEVKGDNKIDDIVVKAKAEAATEVATASEIKYLMYAGSELMEHNVLDNSQLSLSTEGEGDGQKKAPR